MLNQKQNPTSIKELNTRTKQKSRFKQKLKQAKINIVNFVDAPMIYYRGFMNLLYEKGGFGKAYRHLKRTVRKESFAFMFRSVKLKGLDYHYAKYKSINTKDKNITIVTTQHTLFIAHQLQRILVKLDFETQIAFASEKYASHMHIVICPQMYRKLPRKYIAFQMEQSVSSRWFTNDYYRILRSAFAVMDYSICNIQFLQDNHISYKQLFWVPVSPFPNYLDYLSSNQVWDGKRADTAQVVFYGDPNNERRQHYLKALKSKFQVKVVSEKFGNDLYYELMSAKVIVNIHYYENALLETTRIYECLSLGLTVVSEASSDMQYYDHLRESVTFVEIGNIEQMILAIEQALSTTQRNKHPELQTTQPMDHYVCRTLLSLGMIDYSDLVQVCGYSNIPKHPHNFYCLGLPENFSRRQSFLDEHIEHVHVFDGLRHSIGWIGCGLSYKYLFEYAYYNNLDYLIVCEDDVAFPKDFNQKLTDTLNYLSNTPNKWHVFSGFIADVHKETEILNIEKHNGNEYIYLNKMTSTVFNIYHKSFFAKGVTWDNKILDAKKNTIDRFIESTADLIVITTQPFLVGHKEDLKSTLWGIDNTQYQALIDQTSITFSRILDTFNQK